MSDPHPPSEPPPPADELDALRLEVAALRVAVANLRTLVEYQGHRTGTTPVRWLVAPPSVAPGPHPPSHGFHRTP